MSEQQVARARWPVSMSVDMPDGSWYSLSPHCLSPDSVEVFWKRAPGQEPHEYRVIPAAWLAEAIRGLLDRAAMAKQPGAKEGDGC